MEGTNSCSKCKQVLTLENFKRWRGKLTKTCIKCLDINQASKDRSMCPYKRRRAYYKDCGGSQNCHHQKQRACCKDYGGNQICLHQRLRFQCKDCGGGSICEHQNIRSRCKECGGGGIFEHQKGDQGAKTVGVKAYVPIKG
ncbi:uncharacterized protein LOC130648102 [Hydractinia symbiolongicarpus]|uniref:uncharacterized protein LOC130648102 n=1 Tax=Hydractinia symbiolongicarpus TaxID=13093 RepID=UPI00254A8420|nr:uncharacterized protein LOC130648102 [Hydractinia symbiolongicarpus]